MKYRLENQIKKKSATCRTYPTLQFDSLWPCAYPFLLTTVNYAESDSILKCRNQIRSIHLPTVFRFQRLIIFDFAAQRSGCLLTLNLHGLKQFVRQLTHLDESEQAPSTLALQ